MLKSRVGEAGLYTSIVMALILVAYASLYINSLNSMSQQQNYLTESQQIESLKKAENIFFKYVPREEAIYATSTIATSIKTIVIYNAASVVYSSLVEVELAPSSWVKIVEGALARLVAEDNYILGVITENGNLATWSLQKETSIELSATLLPAVRYQSFVNGHPKYVSLATNTTPSELVCDVDLNTECVGTLDVTFVNDRRIVVNAPALYADLIGAYVWVEEPVNITLSIIFAENNFNVPANITLYYLLLPPNSRVVDVITYRHHVSYATHATQPLKKVIIREYLRKSVVVDLVSFTISESITRAGTLVVLALALSLPPGQYPQNPTILLDIELVEVS